MAGEIVNSLDISLELDAKEIVKPSEVITDYLTAIIPQAAGKFSDQAVVNEIRSVQNNLEQQLGIKFHPQIVIEEGRSVVWREYERNILSTKYPVNVPIEFSYQINGQPVYTINRDWITHFNDRRDYGTAYRRSIYLIPTRIGTEKQTLQLTTGTNSFAYFLLHAWSNETVPLGRSVKFITGFRFIPNEFRSYVKRRVAIYLLHQLGEMVKPAGTASMSTTQDGITQSRGSEGWWRATFHSTIETWTAEADAMYKDLAARYRYAAIGVA